jgi:hypothetical protein
MDLPNTVVCQRQGGRRRTKYFLNCSFGYSLNAKIIPIYFKKIPRRLAWWCVTLNPSTQEMKARES